MTRKDYEQTQDYKKALQLVKDFINDVLEGDIERMKTLCFDDLNKYIGDICDPDMYLITQAIYIIVFGDIFDLNFENMGPWDPQGTYAFRGDTMNSFGSLIGKESKDNEFAYRAKFFSADKNPDLWNKILEFSKMYHWLGNFIVLPNRGSIENGINGARAGYYNKEYCEGMRDYFDWFLLAVSKYQDKVRSGDIHLSKFEMQLQQNPEYNPFFLDIAEWKERFFLEPYFDGDVPKQLFCTPLERRLLVTTVPENRKGEWYYQDEEYLALLEDYLDKSKAVIAYRTNRIVECLKEKLRV